MQKNAKKRKDSHTLSCTTICDVTNHEWWSGTGGACLGSFLEQAWNQVTVKQMYAGTPAENICFIKGQTFGSFYWTIQTNNRDIEWMNEFVHIGEVKRLVLKKTCEAVATPQPLSSNFSTASQNLVCANGGRRPKPPLRNVAGRLQHWGL